MTSECRPSLCSRVSLTQSEVIPTKTPLIRAVEVGGGGLAEDAELMVLGKGAGWRRFGRHQPLTLGKEMKRCSPSQGHSMLRCFWPGGGKKGKICTNSLCGRGTSAGPRVLLGVQPQVRPAQMSPVMPRRGFWPVTFSISIRAVCTAEHEYESISEPVTVYVTLSEGVRSQRKDLQFTVHACFLPCLIVFLFSYLLCHYVSHQCEDVFPLSFFIRFWIHMWSFWFVSALQCLFLFDHSFSDELCVCKILQRSNDLLCLTVYWCFGNIPVNIFTF